ncbi:MAG: type II secretion system F family protein [Paenibacillaceae bacterium]
MKPNLSGWITKLLPVSLYLMERFRLMERYPLQVARLHLKWVNYHGGSQSLEQTKLFIARIITYMWGSLLFFTCLGFAVDPAFFSFGACIIISIPVVIIQDLNRKLKFKKRLMLIELTEFLNKLTLLVDAGETVQKAIKICVEQKKQMVITVETSPLYYELNQMVIAINNNRSFQHVLEEFNKRCNVQEISIFTTTVLLNYRRGGLEFVYALRELSRIIWDKRLSLTRTLGEEASAKLVFPMVFIFFIVMVIVAAPAILLMKVNGS